VNRRRAAALVLAVAVAVAALAACGASASAPESTPSTAASGPTAPAGSPSATADGDPAADDGSPTEPAADPTGGEGGTSGTLQPMLTFAGAAGDGYELAGMVPGIVEDGGTCTFEMTSGSTVVRREQGGVADATSTSCGTVQLAATELGVGSWTASVRYEGSAGAGTSATATVVIP
jgi:hypothetical protein